MNDHVIFYDLDLDLDSHDVIIKDKNGKLKEKYKRWKKLVNMTPSQLKRFMDSEDGKKAGLTRRQASRAGKGGKPIKTGRDSAKAILRMKSKPFSQWSKSDIEWMGRQISFISRMLGNSGPLRDKKGRPTRKLLSLKIWGHDPEK